MPTSKNSHPENKNWQNMMDNLWDGVYVVDREKRIEYWNAAAVEITGYQNEDACGNYCRHLLAHHIEATVLCEVACPLDATMKDGKVRDAPVFLKDKHNVSVPVRVRTLPRYDALGNINGAFEIFCKIGDTHETNHFLSELSNIAYVDSLTHASRRNYGEEMLEKAMESFAATKVPFAVLLLDVDNFKSFNDTHGHPFGDTVLTSVSTVAQKNLRRSDLLVRWGGDEFLIISPNIGYQALGKLAAKICRVISDLRLETPEGSSVEISVSIGGTLSNIGDTQEHLLTRVDALMYASKKRGKNCYSLG
jgi:diguanylate cyclase (GGDEF)-like protein/PAS domain S-box-containing protein